MGFQRFTPRGGAPRGGRGGFRGGRGGGRFDNFNQGPPDEVIEVGTLSHPCQEDLVCKLTAEKIPYSNAPVYLKNKEEIGKVDEILGPIKDAFYMDPARFMPLERVLNPPSSRGRGGNRGRGGSRGDFRGGRGGDFHGGRGRGGFGGGRGDFRGGRGNRGDFRGGRGGRGDFRGFRGGGQSDFRGGRRDSFGGKRESNSSFQTQSKKFKEE